jgi:hypothetical protein
MRYYYSKGNERCIENSFPNLNATYSVILQFNGTFTFILGQRLQQ